MTLYKVRIEILLHLHVILLGHKSFLILFRNPYQTNKELAAYFEHVKRLVNLTLLLYKVLVDQDRRKIFRTPQRVILSQIFDECHLALSNELSNLVFLLISLL